MPAVVKADLAKDSPIEQTEIRQMLLNSYITDITKYANPSDTYVLKNDGGTICRCDIIK